MHRSASWGAVGRRAAPLFLGALVTAAVAPPPLGSETDPWIEIRSPHFVVRSDGGETTAVRVAREFELFRAALRQLWPWARVDPPEPVVVYAARSERTLRHLLPFLYEPGGVHPAGVFLTRGGRSYVALRTDVPVPRPDEMSPYHVLYHEYAHLVLALNVEDLPFWLHEGLAEYLGGTVIRNDWVELGRPIRNHLLLLGQERLLPTEELLEMRRSSAELEGDDAGRVYAQSWALVHSLMQDGRVGEYLRLRREGLSDDEVAGRVLGKPEALHRQLEGYLRGRLRSRRVSLSTGDNEGTITGELLAPSRVLAYRGELLLAAGRTNAARALFESAVTMDPEDEVARQALTTLPAPHAGAPRPGPDHLDAFLESRCDDGILSDCVELGQRHQKGIGRPPDLARALELFERACAEGEPEACAQEGWAFEHGQGVESDLERAASAYGWACAGGREWACERLGLLREEGLDAPLEEAVDP